MKRPNSILITVMFCLSATGSAMAGDFKVIANPSVGASAVSIDELKQVFLLQKTALADGSHVEPVLDKAASAHAALLKQVIGKTESALETYYRSLVFTGRARCRKRRTPTPKPSLTWRRRRAQSRASAAARPLPA